MFSKRDLVTYFPKKPSILTMVLLIAGLGLPLGSQAQETLLNQYLDQTVQVSLAQLLDAAKTHNSELKASNAELDVYRENLNELKASYRPQVTLSGGYSFSERESLLQNGQIFDQYTEPKRLSLGINQTLFTGGRRGNLKRSAKHRITAEEARHENRTRSVSSDIIQNFIGYVSASQQSDILFQSIEKLRGIETATLARTEAGDGTRIQLAQAKSRLAASNANLARVQADKGVLQSQIFSRTGFYLDRPFLPDIAKKPIGMNFTSILAKARKHDLAILASQSDEEAAYAQYKSEKNRFLPTISLQASGNMVQDSSPTIARDDDIAAGVTFSMPLYSGGTNKARAKQALARYNATRFRTENLYRQTDMRISGLWSRLESSKSVIKAQEVSLEASTEALEGISRAEAAGLATFDDLLDAEDDKLRAELALLRAKHQLYLARLLIRLQIGELEFQ